MTCIKVCVIESISMNKKILSTIFLNDVNPRNELLVSSFSIYFTIFWYYLKSCSEVVKDLFPIKLFPSVV